MSIILVFIKSTIRVIISQMYLMYTIISLVNKTYCPISYDGLGRDGMERNRKTNIINAQIARVPFGGYSDSSHLCIF